MGIYIKNMEMPKKCIRCPVNVYGRCLVNDDKDVSKATADAVRDKDCPLIPVPPHGRLIDGDALLSRFEKEEKACDEHGREFSSSFLSANEYCTEWWAVQRFLMDEMDAKTVIPESEEAGG